jgi:hypothetical protein
MSLHRLDQAVLNLCPGAVLMVEDSKFGISALTMEVEVPFLILRVKYDTKWFIISRTGQ